MGGKLGEVGVAEAVEPPLGCLIRWPNDPNSNLRRRDHARGGSNSATQTDQGQHTVSQAMESGWSGHSVPVKCDQSDLCSS